MTIMSPELRYAKRYDENITGQNQKGSHILTLTRVGDVARLTKKTDKVELKFGLTH